jgi:hypothetical protein
MKGLILILAIVVLYATGPLSSHAALSLTPRIQLDQARPLQQQVVGANLES